MDMKYEVWSNWSGWNYEAEIARSDAENETLRALLRAIYQAIPRNPQDDSDGMEAILDLIPDEFCVDGDDDAY